MVRMSHPVHGFHIAANAAEQKAMQSSGWKIDDGSALRDKLAAQARAKLAEAGQLKASKK